MSWKRLPAYISGSVDQELRLRNEYLATENRILRNQIQGRLQLNDSDRISMAEIGKRLGRKALEESPKWFVQKLSWPGTAGGLPRISTAPKTARSRVVQPPMTPLRN